MPKEEISCPKCGKQFKTEVAYSVCLDEKPQIKKAILNGKFNCTKCPECKKTIQLTPQVLVTTYSPARWIWLVSKKHQNPAYPENFFKTVAPGVTSKIVKQQIVFVEFGKPAPGLKYVLENTTPETAEGWVSLGKHLTGKEAIRCYQQALRIDKTFNEAKQRLNQELDNLKQYQ